MLLLKCNKNVAIIHISNKFVAKGGIILNDLLEQLFYGNLCPNTDCRNGKEETKELLGYVADHHNTLMQTLSSTQRETFEKYVDCVTELTDIDERDVFSYAFRLGARLMLAALLNLKE